MQDLTVPQGAVYSSLFQFLITNFRMLSFIIIDHSLVSSWQILRAIYSDKLTIEAGYHGFQQKMRQSNPLRFTHRTDT